ncbi:MAG: BBP7 family outer membrane beta-barrel protein [Planctomycetales bacterium]|nr:BBP7 family outer membrane beta-barrel protein [Planctomycetales bacterium]
MKPLLTLPRLFTLAAGALCACGQIGAAQTSILTSYDAAVEDGGDQIAAAEGLPSVEFSPEVYAPFGSSEAGEGAECSGCNGGGAFYNRCGCNTAYFPWIQGPGRCDQWCVGPHWNVELDGLFLFRGANDWAPFTAAVGSGPDFLDTFDNAAGARLFVTGYNDRGYGMQVGYEGVNDFSAAAGYDLGGSNREFSYESNYNSVEINFIPATNARWRLFGGVRYMEIDENLTDVTTVDKPVPPPADPPTSVAYVDTGTARLLDNRMIGFQVGAFRDSWNIGRRLSLEAFANSGLYCNNLRFRSVDTTVTTVYNSDDLASAGDDFSQTTSNVTTGTTRNVTNLAFAGEAGITSVLRINPCLALRGGYQVLLVDGLGLASDAYFSPAFNSSSVLYHGLQFGVEYRR